MLNNERRLYLRKDKKMRNTTKILCAAVVLFILCTGIAHATSYVSADGTVFDKSTYTIVTTYACGNLTCNFSTTYQTLKIQRPDGSKVNADCMASDQILCTCQNAHIGAPASGAATCNDGSCTWTSLEAQ